MPSPIRPASRAPSRDAPSTASIEQAFTAASAALTGGLSPAPYLEAWTRWITQVAGSPELQWKLTADAWHRAADTLSFAQTAAVESPISPQAEPGVTDPRFASPAWEQYPFNVYARAYQNNSAWLSSLPGALGDADATHSALMAFTIRCWLEALSPTNFLATNPELLELTRAEGGENLLRGAKYVIEDIARLLDKKPAAGTEAFEPGTTVATTPGKVVFRNDLIELIQYSPTTPDVYSEPVLIVPAWIMKYYILDLSPKNSFVKFLVDQGHTVFMISWKNPGIEDRDYGMDDYVELGLNAAIDAINHILPDRRIHATGYCIGGTLLAIGAAALARDKNRALASLTFLAAQTDFSEPGELSLFINPQQLSVLESQMAVSGVLESSQMAGAFQMLRPRDLIWAPMVQTYLKGTREPMIDLMAWNADGTRMPYRMHTEYLYRLYLDNELAQGRFPVREAPILLSDIDVPLFAVGTETDHVAPWRSVFKLASLVRSSDYHFLLTSGGHNAGIISGPVHPKRKHRVSAIPTGANAPTADDWLAATPAAAGSWWPVWEAWLSSRSGKRVAPPTLGSTHAGFPPLADAPGEYVRVR